MKCTCDRTIFTNSMCKPCLRSVRDKLTIRIDNLLEKIDDLECDMDQVLFLLGENEQE